MDALQVTFSNTLLGKFYLLSLYAMAAFTVVYRLANIGDILLFLLLLALLFFREWQGLFSSSAKTFHVKGIGYQPQSSQQTWSLFVGAEWQPISELKVFYRVPWFIAVRAVDYPYHQPRIVIIWRDSMTAQEWRLLRIYLSL
jgi:hypothetical protein